jgi:hypothetical protein
VLPWKEQKLAVVVPGAEQQEVGESLQVEDHCWEEQSEEHPILVEQLVVLQTPGER